MKVRSRSKPSAKIVTGPWPPACSECGRRERGVTSRTPLGVSQYTCYWCLDPDAQALRVTRFVAYRDDAQFVRWLEQCQRKRFQAHRAEREAAAARARRARRSFSRAASSDA